MNIIDILNQIEKIYPNPVTELYYETPFQLLIAVVLSAQTTDKQVNKVTKNQWLFQKLKSPQDVIDMWYEALKENIKTIWLYKSKAKNIYNLSKQIISIKDVSSNEERYLFDRFWYIIPDSLNEITKLDWVWEKTGKVVLSVLYNKPVVPVDTHVHRVLNRLGIVCTKTELQTSAQIEKIIPDDLKNKAHHLLILFWRYFCKSKNPKCYKCVFKEFCKYYNLKK